MASRNKKIPFQIPLALDGMRTKEMCHKNQAKCLPEWNTKRLT